MIGAPRCGTTSLHDYLSQHPDIFMPKLKEPFTLAFKNGEFINDNPKSYPFQKQNYKTRLSVPDYNDYLALFQMAKNQKAIGEASTMYIHSPFALENLKKLYPKAKLIVSLRNPVDQVYSSYHFGVRLFKSVSYGKDMKEFRDLAENHIDEFLSHFDSAFYYKHLKPYFDAFPKEQIHVFLFDDFVKDLKTVLRDIFAFLEVDSRFVPTIQIKNKGATYKSRVLNYLLHKSRPVLRAHNVFRTRMPRFIGQPAIALFDWIDDLNSTKPEPLSQETRKKIMAIFREDTQKLQALIGRDLSRWING